MGSAPEVTDMTLPGNSAPNSAPKPANGNPVNVPSRPLKPEGDLLKLLVKYFDHGGSGTVSTNEGPRFRPPLKQEPPEWAESLAGKEVSKPVIEVAE